MNTPTDADSADEVTFRKTLWSHQVQSTKTEIGNKSCSTVMRADIIFFLLLCLLMNCPFIHDVHCQDQQHNSGYSIEDQHNVSDVNVVVDDYNGGYSIAFYSDSSMSYEWCSMGPINYCINYEGYWRKAGDTVSIHPSIWGCPEPVAEIISWDTTTSDFFNIRVVSSTGQPILAAVTLNHSLSQVYDKVRHKYIGYTNAFGNVRFERSLLTKGVIGVSGDVVHRYASGNILLPLRFPETDGIECIQIIEQFDSTGKPLHWINATVAQQLERSHITTVRVSNIVQDYSVFVISDSVLLNQVIQMRDCSHFGDLFYKYHHDVQIPWEVTDRTRWWQFWKWF